MTQTKTGHPRGLYTLFFTEMWERFSYYGMRALLTLFLVAELINNGFGMTRAEAFTIYGVFTGLVYVTPIFGGWLADKVLGQRKAIYIGAVIMAIGQFIMAYSVVAGDHTIVGGDPYRLFFLYSGLSLLIVGNGFFKPNISTIVGGLYEADDPRKDGGFTIFYMGINLGAFIAPLTAGYLGETYGWQYGFTTAGLGMVLGFVWFFFNQKTLENVGMPPNADKDAHLLKIKDYVDVLIWSIGSIILSFAIVFFIDAVSSTVLDSVITIIGIAAVGGIGYSIFTGTQGKTEWSRVAVIFILAIFNIIFWSGFEQAGSTFNLFAADQTDRTIALFNDWVIPASYFQAINAIAIFAIAPIFDVIWGKLTQIGKNPPTPLKFGFALLMLAAGFFVMSAAASAAEHGLVSPLWLVSVYLLHTLGELMISPIGLSMITKLSPPKIVSIMMGIWMGSIAIGNYMAAAMESIANSMGFEQGAPMFRFIAFEALIAGAIAIALAPVIKKMMKGIH